MCHAAGEDEDDAHASWRPRSEQSSPIRTQVNHHHVDPKFSKAELSIGKPSRQPLWELDCQRRPWPTDVENSSGENLPPQGIDYWTASAGSADRSTASDN